MTSPQPLAGEIDESRLPGSALVDTSVMIPGFVRPPTADEDQAAPLFWTAMLTLKRRTLIAAPSVAELLKKQAQTPIPRVDPVEVVPLDFTAAELLGRSFPSDVLKRFTSALGVRADYIKYDAMIVACAVRHRAEVLLTTDAGMKSLSESIGLTVRVPSYFLKPPPPAPPPIVQGSLF